MSRSTTRFESARSKTGLVIAFSVLLVVGGCSTTQTESERPVPAPSLLWNVEDFEIYEWRCDVPEFEPGFALEASGLAMSESFLYIASEKYATVLQLPIDNPTEAWSVPLSVPRHSELEGMVYDNGRLLLCDEAHAAVYEVDITDELKLHQNEKELEARRLELPDLGVRGGKIGFEGLTLDPTNGMIFLLLERSGDPATGCRSTVFRLRQKQGSLETAAPPLEIDLDDCSWRLTGLHFNEGELLALETSYPGFEYRVLAIDPESGSHRVLQDITQLSRSLAEKGYDNNLEGLVLGKNGELFVVSDNNVTGVIDDKTPPRGERKTLLLRLRPNR